MTLATPHQRPPPGMHAQAHEPHRGAVAPLTVGSSYCWWHSNASWPPMSHGSRGREAERDICNAATSSCPWGCTPSCMTAVVGTELPVAAASASATLVAAPLPVACRCAPGRDACNAAPAAATGGAGRDAPPVRWPASPTVAAARPGRVDRRRHLGLAGAPQRLWRLSQSLYTHKLQPYICRPHAERWRHVAVSC